MSTDRVYPDRLVTGMWLVHVHSPQYRAWAFWLRGAFGKRFFPVPVMQVMGEFPPTTNEGAAAVADHLAALRKELKSHRPVNLWPEPWDGYIPPFDDGRGVVSLEAMQAIRARLFPQRVEKPVLPRSLLDLPPAPVSQALRDKVRTELGFPSDDDGDNGPQTA